LKASLNKLNKENEILKKEILDLNKHIDSTKLIQTELNSQLILLRNEIEKSKQLKDTIIALEKDNRLLKETNHDYQWKQNDFELRLRNKANEIGELYEKLE
jgi:hypothetical protein